MACLLFPLARVAFLLGFFNPFFFFAEGAFIRFPDFLKAQGKNVVFQLKFGFLSSVLYLNSVPSFSSLTVIGYRHGDK